jgi:hypothetical protein
MDGVPGVGAIHESPLPQFSEPIMVKHTYAEFKTSK